LQNIYNYITRAHTFANWENWSIFNQELTAEVYTLSAGITDCPTEVDNQQSAITTPPKLTFTNYYVTPNRDVVQINNSDSGDVLLSYYTSLE